MHGNLIYGKMNVSYSPVRFYGAQRYGTFTVAFASSILSGIVYTALVPKRQSEDVEAEISLEDWAGGLKSKCQAPRDVP